MKIKQWLILAAALAFSGCLTGHAQAACPTAPVITNGQTTFSSAVNATWVVCGINNCSTAQACGFNVYRASVAAGATCSTQSFTKITATPTATLPYTDSTAGIGNFCYYVTSVSGGAENPTPANYAFVTLYPPQVTQVVGAP
jgi:hypothetical protein